MNAAARSSAAGADAAATTSFARSPQDALALQEEKRAHQDHAGMDGGQSLRTIALAVGLAYLFGFGLTSVPLLRAGLAFGAIVPIALAADTVSITIMEAIDNAFVLLVPRAMEAGLGDPLLWAAIAGGFVIAYPFAFLANRYMIARGKGHALVHEYHH